MRMLWNHVARFYQTVLATREQVWLPGALRVHMLGNLSMCARTLRNRGAPPKRISQEASGGSNVMTIAMAIVPKVQHLYVKGQKVLSTDRSTRMDWMADNQVAPKFCPGRWTNVSFMGSNRASSRHLRTTAGMQTVLAIQH
jgi:hypothetical protein